MSSSPDRLVYMANQIGKFFQSQGHDKAVPGVAEHIRKFWDPRMRKQIYAHLNAGGAGLIYGLMSGKGPQWAVECGAAHGALAMTTPGDTTMATLAEVERVMKGGSARVAR